MVNEIIIIVSAAIIIGCMATIAKHIINNERHPAKKDIVFRDVCEPKMKGLKDCLEAKIDGLTDLTKQGFESLKELIKDGK